MKPSSEQEIPLQQANDLYFDMEQVRSTLSSVYNQLLTLNGIVVKPFVKQLLAEGEDSEAIRPLAPQAPLTIASRSGMSSSINMLLPQLVQMTRNADEIQGICEMINPDLVTSPTVN